MKIAQSAVVIFQPARLAQKVLFTLFLKRLAWRADFLMLLELQIEQLTAVFDDVRRQLKGHPDSRLDGENGLAAATMRRVEQLEECCRIALRIRDKLQQYGSLWGVADEWAEIETALDLAAPAEDKPNQSSASDPAIPCCTKCGCILRNPHVNGMCGLCGLCADDVLNGK